MTSAPSSEPSTAPSHVSADLPASTEVVVIGAGLAGLAASRVIQEAGRSVVVVEASDGIGGRVRTDEVDGYLLDRGFQVLLTAYPELHTQVDLHALDLRRFDPGAVVWDGSSFATVGDPLRQPSTLWSSLTAPIGSPVDKARILAQRLRLLRADPRRLLRGRDITTIAALRDEGFSETIISRFFQPLVGGIQLDPSLRTSRRMFDVILRSLITGDVAVPARGMGRLPAQLASRLQPGTIRLNTPAAAVSGGRVRLGDGRIIEAERIVVATEGPVASQLLDLPPVESNSATCVWYGTDQPIVAGPLSRPAIVLDGTMQGPALNIAPMSRVAPGYAPADSTLVAAACPGMYRPDVEPEVRRQLRSLFGPSVDRWRHLRTDTIAHGQPRQYPPFSPKRRVDLGDGIFVCGDHRDTSSLQGAMYSGRRCGEAVVSSL